MGQIQNEKEPEQRKAQLCGDTQQVMGCPLTIVVVDINRTGAAETGEVQNDGRVQLARLKAAARQKDAEAQYQLGVCLEEGRYTKPDARQAVYWYTRAAMQLHGAAMCRLAVCYYTGSYVAVDEALAEALLLVSGAREMAAEYLEKWFHIDPAVEKSYRYHESLLEALEDVTAFLKSANTEILEAIEDEWIAEQYAEKTEEHDDDSDAGEEEADAWNNHQYSVPHRHLPVKISIELFLDTL